MSNEMKYAIGVKLVQFKQMTLGDYNAFKGWNIPENEDPNREGYMVKYSDDYISWCPKEVFEKSNLEIEKPDSISQSDVDKFILGQEVTKIGPKTTVARFTMINGFDSVESSACVSPENYNEEIGTEICKERVKNYIWNHLGFLLQCAKYGFNQK